MIRKVLLALPLVLWASCSLAEAELEYRLPLAPAGYQHLKPYFQQSAKVRTDLYLSCPSCKPDSKLRLCQKDKEEICLQHSEKITEKTFYCKDIPLTLSEFKQEERCKPPKGKLKEAVSLGHSYLSQVQRNDVPHAQAKAQLFASLVQGDLKSFFSIVKLEDNKPPLPNYRNTKLRCKLRVFLGITFYQDEHGREQSRYEIEAKLKKGASNVDVPALLCEFIERTKLRLSDIDMAPSTQLKAEDKISF
jgi:hypothetical protein